MTACNSMTLSTACMRRSQGTRHVGSPNCCVCAAVIIAIGTANDPVSPHMLSASWWLRHVGRQ
jgi:hypothetical protein